MKQAKHNNNILIAKFLSFRKKDIRIEAKFVRSNMWRRQWRHVTFRTKLYPNLKLILTPICYSSQPLFQSYPWLMVVVKLKAWSTASGSRVGFHIYCQWQ